MRRYKRFLADVRHDDGSRETVHCPNSGSMRGLTDADRRVLVSLAPRPESRKLPRTLEAIRIGRTWVCTNTHRANEVAGAALRARCILELAEYRNVRSEVTVSAESRIDFLLSGHAVDPDCFVEVKSVTQRVGQGALFPDAVTERGRRHLEELVALARGGQRAALLFLVLRGDCTFVGPADDVDPEYGRTLRWAAARGVLVLGYRASFSRRGIALCGRLPVVLDPPAVSSSRPCSP